MTEDGCVLLEMTADGCVLLRMAADGLGYPVLYLKEYTPYGQCSDDPNVLMSRDGFGMLIVSQHQATCSIISGLAYHC